MSMRRFVLVSSTCLLAGCAARRSDSAAARDAPSNIDAPLQKEAEKALRATGRAGAVVAFDPNTGAVRVAYSVRGDRGDPLLTAHMPASTFKVFAAIAGLEAGAITATTERECTGAFPFAGKELRCSKAHGRENTSQAIVRSCNSFFYGVGAEIDHARVLEVARRFGFGSRTGIELSDEPGSVPNDARYEEIKRDPTNTMPLLDAIGHGEIRVTLLQLARAFAVFANGGKLVRLGLAHEGGVERTVPIRAEDLALVRRALVDVVETEDGTAHAFAIPGFPYAGKTGSGEAPSLNGVDSGDDIWFVAYAPPNDAKILIAARVERADVVRDARFVVHDVLEAWRTARP